MNLIMEHHAYMWSVDQERRFGVDFGAKEMLESTEFDLEPWGYFCLFSINEKINDFFSCA